MTEEAIQEAEVGSVNSQSDFQESTNNHPRILT